MTAGDEGCTPVSNESKRLTDGVSESTNPSGDRAVPSGGLPPTFEIGGFGHGAGLLAADEGSHTMGLDAADAGHPGVINADGEGMGGARGGHFLVDRTPPPLARRATNNDGDTRQVIAPAVIGEDLVPMSPIVSNEVSNEDPIQGMGGLPQHPDAP